MIKRRSVSVQAVRCGKDNADEVNAFLDRNRSPFMYSVNEHGAWQRLRGRSYREKRTMLVWVDSWLVVVPEVKVDGGIVNVHASEFERLYRS